MFDEPREALAKLDVLEVQVILAQLLKLSWFQFGEEVLDSQIGLLLDKRPALFSAKCQVVRHQLVYPHSTVLLLIRTLRSTMAAMYLVVAVAAASPRDPLIRVSRCVSVRACAPVSQNRNAIHFLDWNRKNSLAPGESPHCNLIYWYTRVMLWIES
jgi:hypothetical protein